jgi:hypothetical protein
VEIGCDQIAGLNVHAADVDGNVVGHSVYISVRHEYFFGPKREAHLFCFVGVAHTAVCHNSDAIKPECDVALYFTPVGADRCRLIEVVKYDHTR